MSRIIITNPAEKIFHVERYILSPNFDYFRFLEDAHDFQKDDVFRPLNFKSDYQLFETTNLNDLTKEELSYIEQTPSYKFFQKIHSQPQQMGN